LEAPVSISLELESVSVRMGRNLALADISLRARSSELIVLKGDNGAGKSTLLRVLAGQLLPASGRYTRTQIPRETIGFLPQHAALYGELSVREQLTLAARLYAAPVGSIDHWLSRFALEAHAERAVSSLSRGMAQRVGLIQACIHRPTLLLLDEPTTALDRLSVLSLLNVLDEQRQDRIILLATHDATPFLDRAERIVHLLDGRIAQTTDLSAWRRTLEVHLLDPSTAERLAFACVESVMMSNPRQAQLELKPSATVDDLARSLSEARIAITHLARPNP